MNDILLKAHTLHELYTQSLNNKKNGHYDLVAVGSKISTDSCSEYR